MEEKSICPKCESTIKEDDDFCPECGTILIENLHCKNHIKSEAKGVCIVCCEPYCKKCGFFVNDSIFLCDEHSNYEIYEGMARIFGSSDTNQVEYLKDCLVSEGFHPFIYSRKASPLSIGGPDYTLFRASGEFDGHIINELKLMVPCQEVIESEKVVQEIIIRDNLK